MGDRISIQFQNGEEKSVVLFSHWDGESLLQTVVNYLAELKEERTNEGVSFPIDRKEPNTIMVDFISWLTNGERIYSNYYLGKDEYDGDNSNNGHWVYDLIQGGFTKK